MFWKVWLNPRGAENHDDEDIGDFAEKQVKTSDFCS